MIYIQFVNYIPISYLNYIPISYLTDYLCQMAISVGPNANKLNGCRQLLRLAYLLAPVHTIFPELNMRAVVRGSLILIITAAKR